jgi:aspartyl-tRNA(Asn)/glutamyl-tRNA(Gln) amidotransferase subunit A
MNTSKKQSYSFRDLTEISELIRKRQVSPVDVVSACLERIEHMQPKLNAFISVAADSARHAARTAEREIGAGRWRGPLHGIPIGIKDFYDPLVVPRWRDRSQHLRSVSCSECADGCF